jgi:hypothetical protein
MHAKRFWLYGTEGPPGPTGRKASLYDRLDNGTNHYGPIPPHAPWLGACTVWTRSVNKVSGYGVIGYQYRKYLVHHVAWQREHGPIPDDMRLEQLCGNRRCIRTDHLQLTPRVSARGHPDVTSWLHRQSTKELQ